jgi:hypothetical protein
VAETSQIFSERDERAAFDVARKDLPNHFGFFGDHVELPLLGSFRQSIAQGRHARDPEAFLL